MLAVGYGLISALVWGGGDFVGGLASRQVGAYRAVMYGELVGLALLAAIALVIGEPMITAETGLVSALAGMVGCLGLLVLYHAMTSGQMSVAAPVSALLAAALPVLVSAFTEGTPTLIQGIGFGCALAGIWLISQSETGFQVKRLVELRLPLLAGLGFGLYFILTHHAAQTAIVGPLIASRLAGATLLMIFILARREGLAVSRKAWGLISLNALLDVGGNAFYILAGQAGRLDVAAVLSSLYPGGTVLLAWLILKERLSPAQRLGIGAALAAIVLMTV